MEQLFHAAAEYYVITALAGCFALGSLLRSMTQIVTSSSRERSRREIAAFIAEGSITPEQGERLMRAELSRRAA